MFYTWLSVIPFTTPEQTPPLVETHPPGKHPLVRDTPRASPHPRRHPPGQCMLGYCQQAGGTHPTRMQTCLWGFSSFENLFIWVDPVRLSSRTNCPLEFELRLVSNLRTCTRLTCLFKFGQVSIYLHPPVLEICMYVNKSD